MRAGEDHIPAVSRGVFGCCQLMVVTCHQSFACPRLEDGLVDRIECEQRIAREIHLGHQPLGELPAEDREMDMRRPPGIVVITPRVGPGFDREKAVATVRSGEAATRAGEVGIQRRVVPISCVDIASRGVRLPDLHQLTCDRVPLAVENSTRHDDPFTDRLGSRARGEVGFERIHFGVPEARGEKLDFFRVGVHRQLCGMPQEATAVGRKVQARLSFGEPRAAVLDSGIDDLGGDLLLISKPARGSRRSGDEERLGFFVHTGRVGCAQNGVRKRLPFNGRGGEVMVARGDTVTQRSLALLGAFDETHRCLRLNELSLRAGLPLSTAHRLVRELVGWGALERLPGGGYVIGRRLWGLGLLAPMQTGLRRIAEPFLHDIHAATRATVHIAVREGTGVLYLDRLSGHASVPIVSTVGTRLPLHCTGVGKVLLAHAPVEVRREVLESLTRVTPYTIVQPGRLSRQLNAVLVDGFATTREEMSLGACSVAVPVGSRGAVVGALGIVVPEFKRDKPRLVAALQVAARGIDRCLLRDGLDTDLTTSKP